MVGINTRRYDARATGVNGQRLRLQTDDRKTAVEFAIGHHGQVMDRETFGLLIPAENAGEWWWHEAPVIAER